MRATGADANAHFDSNADSYGNRDTDTYSNTYTKINSDAESSTDTAPPPVTTSPTKYRRGLRPSNT